LSGNLLATNTVNLSDLLSGEKRFEVPLYQRDYSWREDNWEELWNDILEVTSDDTSKHYMGSLVLQKYEDQKYKIIDGQQRITTLSIFVLSLLSVLDDFINSDNETEDNKKRAEIIRGRYIGDVDPSSLRYSSKLKLNSNNNDVYERFVIQLQEPPNQRALNPSSKLILKCSEYFKRKIYRYIGENTTGEFIVNFLTNEVARKLIFIQIEVEDELSAYTVFETLNARGIELSSSDLLKNYLFSLLVSDTDQQIIQRQWDIISNNVNNADLPDFLRYYINSTEKLVRSSQLFKRIKGNVKTAADAQAFLDILEVESDIFRAIKDPSHNLWDSNPHAKKHLKAIKVFGVKQVYSLLLISYRKLSDHDFVRVLKLLESLLFRYSTIAKQNPNSLEAVINSACVKLHSEQISTPRAIFNELRDVYIDDIEFVQAFQKARIVTKNRKKLVRYIIFALENHIRATELDWETNTATIEHILPENPSPEWSQFISEEVQGEYIYRLGNYTLLSSSDNRSVANALFESKIETYSNSDFLVTSEISSTNWNQDSIEERQMALAERARVLWRVDFPR
jgi:uncharacterized protein with ParB-like and HNH nuclease domain